MKIGLKVGDLDDMCPICYCEKLNTESPVIQLACKHRFHKKCIRTWLKSCPVCRKIIFSDKKKEILSDKKMYFNELSFIFDEPSPLPDLQEHLPRNYIFCKREKK